MTGSQGIECSYSKGCSRRKTQHVQRFTDESEHRLQFKELRGHYGLSEGYEKSRRRQSDLGSLSGLVSIIVMVNKSQ